MLLPAWYENAPLTILEAYTYGKPVLGARIGGIPEMIEVGKTGDLFVPRDLKELRERILNMWKERETSFYFYKDDMHIVTDNRVIA